MPDRTQRLLLLAAAEPVGDPRLLLRAAELVGLGVEAAVPAEAVGLIELAAQVRFHHPLVRSAIYRSAPLADRQAVHRALAEATDAQADPDRRAWHRAQAALGADEDLAAELERSAERAKARGGMAAAAAFLERAAALTPDRPRRARRALAAAQSKYLAGSPQAALKLLESAASAPMDGLEIAMAERLRGRIALHVSRVWRRCVGSPMRRRGSNRSIRDSRAKPTWKPYTRRPSPGGLAWGCGTRPSRRATAPADPGPQRARTRSWMARGQVHGRDLRRRSDARSHLAASLDGNEDYEEMCAGHGSRVAVAADVFDDETRIYWPADTYWIARGEGAQRLADRPREPLADARFGRGSWTQRPRWSRKSIRSSTQPAADGSTFQS